MSTLPVIGDVPVATALLFDLGVFALVVGATVLMLVALAHQSLRAGAPARAAGAEAPAAGGGGLMELVARARHRRARRAPASGCCCGRAPTRSSSGWRCSPTAVNLFIFSMGRLRVGAAPILAEGGAVDPAAYADPVPQALVLTAIVIGFATTALFLVVLLASRGLTGTDHVDGREPRPSDARARAPDHRADPDPARRRGADAASTRTRQAKRIISLISACAAARSSRWRSLQRSEAPAGGTEVGSTCSATGPRPSPSCWCSTGCRR